MKKITLAFALLLFIAFSFTNCTTLFRGSYQKVELYTNTDSATLKLDTTVIIGKKHIINLPRSLGTSFEIRKQGYESQKVKLAEISSYFPGNIFLGLTTATGILLANHSTSSSSIAAGAFLGIWLIGGTIDLATGSHYQYHPRVVQVNLYPSLKRQSYSGLSINCTNVSFPESKFITPIGTRVLYLQLQSMPNYLSTIKALQPSTVTDLINEYLNELDCSVIGKNFNKDTLSKFSIDVIIDSLVLNDEMIKANDKIELEKNRTSGEIIHDYSERYTYTHLALKANWQIINNYTGEKINKTVVTDINYYSESIAQVLNKHIRTNFNQFLNDKEVNQLLND